MVPGGSVAVGTGAKLADEREHVWPLVKLALAKAGVERPMREFHDWRHSGITNAAAAWMSPLAIMRMAGHADFTTTEKYIDLAKVIFSDEVAMLGDWYASSGTSNRYENSGDAAATRMAAASAAR